MEERGSRRTLTRRAVVRGAAAAGVSAAWFGRGPALAQDKVLKVGVLLPRSGYLAQPGQACQRGADIAPDVLGGLGLRIEVLSADTESNADVARARTEKLIQDGAQVIVGAFESGQTTAAAQVCEQRGIPLVINIAAAPQITEQGYRTVFRNFPTSDTLVAQGLGLMKDLFAASGRTPASAVFLHANDTFGQANRAALEKAWPRAAMPFPAPDAIGYDPKAQDLSVEVSKARATGAELVIVTTRANDAIMLVREMVKQRYEPLALVSPGSPGMYDEQFYKVLGKYSDYCISNVPWIDPHSPLAPRIEQAFRRRFPNDRYEGYEFNIGFTVEAILIAADAWRRAGTAEPASLLEALRRTDLAEKVMIGGPVRFDAKGQNDAIASACIQNRGQRPTVVLPKASAEADPVFPMPGWQKRS